MRAKFLRPCQACHDDESVFEVEMCPEEFTPYCLLCGRAMVTVIWDARKFRARIQSLTPLPDLPEKPNPAPKALPPAPPPEKKLPEATAPKKRGRPPKSLAEPAPSPQVPKTESPEPPKETTTLDSILGL